MPAGKKRAVLETGLRFGRLTIIGYAGPDKRGASSFACKCDCGNECVVMLRNLRCKRTTSCGCLLKDSTGDRFRKHGMCGTPEYGAYKEARKRCRNPKNKDYPSYGGRGIEFRFDSFIEFFADIGQKKNPRLTLDRIDNNGHYEAGNIHWVTQRRNLQNRRPIEEWKGLPGRPRVNARPFSPQKS
jgi:hypothetical protein